MNKSKNGQTAVEFCVIVGIIIILLAGLILGPLNKYVLGNKQFVDFKQNFNVAYVLGDSNKFERVKIKAWKDWEDSDAVQVIKEDGTPVYTHLRNVKLTHE